MKIGVIRLSSLGDVVLSSAVLQPLYERGFDITYITFKPFGELFKKDYRISNLIEVSKENLKGLKQIKNFSENLKELDLILDIHSNLRTFLISKFSQVPTLKYNKKSLKRRMFTNTFLKKFVNLEGYNVVNAYLKPLEKLGIKGNYRPKIILDENDFPKINLPDDFIAIGTGARYQSKVYPYFKDVIDLLQKDGENIVLIGSAEDKKKDRNVYKNVIDLRGKLSLRESAAVLSKAKLTISNDSAIAHISRAVKTKVLVIYGATHPFLGFYPFEDEGNYMYANLKCQPCDLHGKKECKYKNYACFDKIKPQQVYTEAMNLIEK